MRLADTSVRASGHQTGAMSIRGPTMNGTSGSPIRRSPSARYCATRCCRCQLVFTLSAAAPNHLANRRKDLTSDLKSKPHSVMQCASSTATKHSPYIEEQRPAGVGSIVWSLPTKLQRCCWSSEHHRSRAPSQMLRVATRTHQLPLALTAVLCSALMRPALWAASSGCKRSMRASVWVVPAWQERIAISGQS